jgi:hypothetical protein
VAENLITNPEIAEILERVADLLEAQGANRYRVLAYRTAARTIRHHDRPLSEIFSEGGVEAIDALPTIGRTLAAHVAELVHRHGLTLLDRLEGEVSPERLLATVPGIGPKLAARIHQELSVDTLEDLEAAAHDGRLDRVAGFGLRRIRAIQEELASILGRSARHRARRRAWLESLRTPRADDHVVPRPDVATLLDVDAEYRDRAAKGRLRCITPRRFNPERKAWLPILHTERDDWYLTALFSNTARAHELGRTEDWVVIFYACDGDEGQCTIVNETHGPLLGQRVVRGRETESRQHYASVAQTSDQQADALEDGRRRDIELA